MWSTRIIRNFAKKSSLIKIHDKQFESYLSSNEIQDKVQEMAAEINAEYLGKELIFISVLNGSFMFMSDLSKKIDLDCQISFVKVSSYNGISTSGRVDELIGLNTDVTGKHIVVVEDIVDTGITMNKIFSYLSSFEPASLKIASLLFKPDAFKGKHKPDFVGFVIPNKFVVGYGLDYNELGRNFDEIYKLKED
jgi:hypoxanthine phosphoribosyltransferase